MLSATSFDYAAARRVPSGQAAHTAGPDVASQSRRLEAMGRLTGGLAHDFNNLLTVIMGVTEALSESLDEGSDQQQLAIAGLRAAERGADLVRRLLADTREDARKPQTIDANAMIGEVASLMRHAVGRNVTVEATQRAYSVLCVADHTDLTSALMNLCSNARDAMPSGGTLAIETDRVVLSDTASQALDLRPGTYVTFTVRDTGAGMSPETLKRATEPFFTTKGVAGTGLGLATSYAFARESGGHLAISSLEGEGTTITLYLPRFRGAKRTGFRLLEVADA